MKLRLEVLSIVVSLTTLSLISWYIYSSKTTAKMSSLVTLEPLRLVNEQFLSCWNTIPDEIKSWMGNELVTAVQPPVEANCQLLKDENYTEQERVMNELENWTNSETVDEFYTKIQSCFYVRNLLSGYNFYTSAAEKRFSLAYSILFHGSPQQIVRLLRVIYRPHNVYCLHPDGKSNKTMIQAFRQMASCFDNIFVPDELVNVTYTHISTVDAQLNCLHHLVSDYQHLHWKYASNLCGKELPFNSNRVLVEKLKEMNGDSVVNVRKMQYENFKQRFTSHYRVRNETMKEIGPRMEYVPFGMQLYKSYSYVSVSHQFAIFLLTSQRVKALHRYMSTALMPDEEFYATAYMLPEAPTAHLIGHKLSLVAGFFADSSKLCEGKKIHYSCILNVRNIPLLHQFNGGNDNIMFYNKYFMEYDHVVMDCMEKRIVEQNKLEYERDCYHILQD